MRAEEDIEARKKEHRTGRIIGISGVVVGIVGIIVGVVVALLL